MKVATKFFSTAVIALVLGAMSAQAAEIKRVRCRVDTTSNHLQISVDARNFDRDGVLDGETREVFIKNQGDTVGPIVGEIFDGGDLKVEWDSEADEFGEIPGDENEGQRETILFDFAQVGDMVVATVAGLSRTTECKKK